MRALALALMLAGCVTPADTERLIAEARFALVAAELLVGSVGLSAEDLGYAREAISVGRMGIAAAEAAQEAADTQSAEAAARAAIRAIEAARGIAEAVR